MKLSSPEIPYKIETPKRKIAVATAEFIRYLIAASLGRYLSQKPISMQHATNSVSIATNIETKLFALTKHIAENVPMSIIK